jgi:hypothetical protein
MPSSLVVSVGGDLWPGIGMDALSVSAWFQGAELHSATRSLYRGDGLPQRFTIPSGSDSDMLVDLTVEATLGTETVLSVSRPAVIEPGRQSTVNLCLWIQCIGSEDEGCRAGACEPRPDGGDGDGDADADGDADGDAPGCISESFDDAFVDAPPAGPIHIVGQNVWTEDLAYAAASGTRPMPFEVVEIAPARARAVSGLALHVAEDQTFIASLGDSGRRARFVSETSLCSADVPGVECTVAIGFERVGLAADDCRSGATSVWVCLTEGSQELCLLRAYDGWNAVSPEPGVQVHAGLTCTGCGERLYDLDGDAIAPPDGFSWVDLRVVFGGGGEFQYFVDGEQVELVATPSTLDWDESRTTVSIGAFRWNCKGPLEVWVDDIVCRPRP